MLFYVKNFVRSLVHWKKLPIFATDYMVAETDRTALKVVALSFALFVRSFVRWCKGSRFRLIYQIFSQKFSQKRVIFLRKRVKRPFEAIKTSIL